MSFENLGLRAELMRAVSAEGYTCPTPIQNQAVPVILAGRDVLAGAQTGTGKTAAFTLPMLQLLSDRPRRGRAPRALVLTPTRELAAQVGESVATYGSHLPLRSTIVFGGVGINPQKDALRSGVDILIATPGRLLDHAGQGTVDLSAVEILVLDEADRMLDMGFIHDIRKVLKLLPARRQNLLFSATYSNDIKSLADKLLHEPALIEVARRNTAAENVSQHVYRVEKEAKRDLLIHLIDAGQWYQVLVFNRTKHGSNRLAEQLNRAGIEAAAIHGNKSQGARTRALAGFKDGSVRVLVATDIAARGLDIDRLPHVVNYELPNVPEDYVHRIGRTGRAGEAGAALSLVSDDELKLLKDIQRVLKKDIPVMPVPAFEPRLLKSAPESKPNPKPKAGRGRQPAPGNKPRAARTGKTGGGEAPAGQRRQRSRGRSSRPAGSAR
ncbi:DEAD/DEAH box helicase [Thiohalobacter thiocyanaticus]|uniref:DEAD-box ATP-dependent RNA helicase RhpA n=1 Tax=Thiohalobacter thiocyanaticus TaxID=585455 RepID=A0A426QGB0_9GAMM|nr:DEAD/DEAH box helicase [Thiohalobacter thiocyanaticus]RRQ20773.1 DEAD/DEAH box helicase [Thiohalobacter thiocyanaticus]